MKVFGFIGIEATGSLSPFIPLFLVLFHIQWGLVFFPKCWDVQDWSRQDFLMAVCDFFIWFHFMLYSCAFGFMPIHHFWRFLLWCLVCFLLFWMRTAILARGLRSSAPAFISFLAEDGERVLDFLFVCDCPFRSESVETKNRRLKNGRTEGRFKSRWSVVHICAGL